MCHFQALFLHGRVTHVAGPGRVNSADQTKAGQAQGSRRSKRKFLECSGQRSNRQKVEGRLPPSQPPAPSHGPPTRPPVRTGRLQHLYLIRSMPSPPPSLWALLKYDVVILCSLWPARGREVLPCWVDVLEAAGVPVHCGLPPPGLPLGLLWAVVQGQGSHSFRLIVYVVGWRGRVLRNAVIQRVRWGWGRDHQGAPQALPQVTGHCIERHCILPLWAPWPGGRHWRRGRRRWQ